MLFQRMPLRRLTISVFIVRLISLNIHVKKGKDVNRICILLKRNRLTVINWFWAHRHTVYRRNWQCTVRYTTTDVFSPLRFVNDIGFINYQMPLILMTLIDSDLIAHSALSDITLDSQWIDTTQPHYRQPIHQRYSQIMIDPTCVQIAS